MNGWKINIHVISIKMDGVSHDLVVLVNPVDASLIGLSNQSSRLTFS